MSMPHGSETPLEIIKSAFIDLCENAGEMSVRLPPIPLGPVDRVMNLARITAAVSGRNTDPAVRTLVWQQVIRKARCERGDWMLVAAGLAYPKLVHKSQLLSARFRGDTSEDQADLIASFFDAASRIDLESEEIYDLGVALAWRAYTAVRRERRNAAMSSGCGTSLEEMGIVQVPPHPDIFLARAVRLGVLTEAEAEYIGRSYFESADAEAIAEWAGISRSTFFRHRAAAELRLVEAIRSGLL